MAEVPSERTLSLVSSNASLPPPSSSLIVLLECGQPHVGSRRFDLQGLDRILVGREGKPFPIPEGKSLKIEIKDATISSPHAQLVPTLDRWIVEDLQSKNHLLVNGVVEQRAILKNCDILQLGHTLFMFSEGAVDSDDTGEAF